MLKKLQKLRESHLDITITNAIRQEIEHILSDFSYTIDDDSKILELQLYLNIEELWLMRSIIYRTFQDLSSKYRDISSVNTYQHCPYYQSNELLRTMINSPICNNVDTDCLFNLQIFKKPLKAYLKYYEDLLLERYMLLRQFCRSKYDIERKEFLALLPKNLLPDIKLAIVSYLGDFYGSDYYFIYLDKLLGIIA